MKYRLYATLAMILWLGGGMTAVSGEVLYQEDFEGTNPVQFWESDGEYQVNFAGLTSEKTYNGKQCFKLDVTFNSGTYARWSAPMNVPAVPGLVVRGRVLITQLPGSTHVGMGCKFVFPVGDASYPVRFRRRSGASEEWSQERLEIKEHVVDTDRRWISLAEVIGAIDAGVHTDRWYIVVLPSWYTQFQGQRVVLYIDEVIAEGEVPENWDQQQEQRRARLIKERLDKVAEVQARLTKARKDLSSAIPAPGQVPPQVEKHVHELASWLSSSLDEEEAVAERAASGSGLMPLDWVAHLETTINCVETTLSHLKNLPQACRGARAPLTTYVTTPITNDYVLANRFDFSGKQSNRISSFACPAEYESVTFTVFALEDLSSVSVEAHDLVSGNNQIPADRLDIKLVKCWWQGGKSIHNVSLETRRFVPELLLNDPDFVTSDHYTRTNAVRNVEAPKDAPTLQLVDIPAGNAQQYWVTIHVPDDTQPGVYRGNLLVKAHNKDPVPVRLRLRVLPFKLAEPVLLYSLYYAGRLAEEPTIGAYHKSRRQLEAELRDLIAHGVTNPTTYQSMGKLPEELAVRQQIGMVSDPLLFLNWGPRNPQDEEGLKRVRETVKKVREIAAEFGIEQVYFYGMDEARGERLSSQRLAWEAVHEAGGKVFVATYSDFIERVGDLLDLAVYSGMPPREIVDQVHAFGNKIINYGNPQVGCEEPLTYRRNYGLLLWKRGLDGGCTFAYQWQFGSSIWDDCDDIHYTYRDHVFAYPTADGIIDTLQWEGWREGVDDVRYLSTLLAAMQRCTQEGKHEQLVRQTQAWLDNLDITGDLQRIRREMAKRIMQYNFNSTGDTNDRSQ